MKSCLKHTPPVTPTLSASGTPNDSRNGSPRTESLAPSIRKMVSFCEDEEGLEEVHYADDWDRSPTPMTPRLSYQDILELKQLQLTLPRAPTYRQFTTSTPHPSCLSTPGSSSSRQPFPVSRFATAQSLTPSKWKNREESQSSVDPDILPYLDAVPIQLLPLLDTAAATPVGPPVATPAPSTSPPTPKTRAVSPPHVPAQPTPPSVSSSSLDSPTSPTTTPTSSPRRTPNFTFLPLLPIEEPKPAPPPPVQKPPEPKRKINMTFLPLMPVNETQPSSNAVIADASPKDKIEPMSESMTSNYSQAKDVSPELHQLDANLECQNDMTDSYFRTPSPTSTPALSSASDTDTESEAPSTSNPPSPNEPELMGTFASSTNSEGRRERGTINPYFPLLPSHAVAPNTRPGQTPPFSMIYPEYAQGENLRTPSSDDSEVTLSNLVNKVKLQAIPSPSLAPPSPFSLYPPSKNPSPIEERFARGQTQSGVMTKRAFAAARSRSALSLSSIPIPPSLHMEAEEQLGPSFSRRRESQDWS